MEELSNPLSLTPGAPLTPFLLRGHSASAQYSPVLPSAKETSATRSPITLFIELFIYCIILSLLNIYFWLFFFSCFVTYLPHQNINSLTVGTLSV